MSEIVRLNFGGVLYTTTRATLCTYPDSMLGAMFSGKYGLSTDENGCFFIDRDGTMFQYILAFLRSNSLILPLNFTDYELLKNEAEFYQIKPLLEALSGYGKEEQKCLEILERMDGDVNSVYRGSTCVIGMKDILLELPACFGLDVEEVEERLSRSVPQDIPHALVCRMRYSGYSEINLRHSLASYLRQQGWKLVQSTSTSKSVHERWTLGNKNLT